MKLHELQTKNKSKKKKRVGRGPGSGRGTYSGRGIKGQKSRSGYKIPAPVLIGKLPKLRGEGFTSIKKENKVAATLFAIDKKYKSGEVVNLESLLKKGIIKSKNKKRIDKIKILATGKLTKKLKFADNLIYSKKAKEQIDKIKNA